jgi:hypothetical protein
MDQKDRRGMRKGKGYYWNKQNQKWHDQIHVGGREGKHIYLGSFSTEEEARTAYLEALDAKRDRGN